MSWKLRNAPLILLTDYLIKFCILYFFQIGDLPGHYHLRHDDVDELNKEHNRDKTDRLLLEKEVGLLHCGLHCIILPFHFR